MVSNAVVIKAKARPNPVPKCDALKDTDYIAARDVYDEFTGQVSFRVRKAVRTVFEESGVMLALMRSEDSRPLTCDARTVLTHALLKYAKLTAEEAARVVNKGKTFAALAEERVDAAQGSESGTPFSDLLERTMRRLGEGHAA